MADGDEAADGADSEGAGKKKSPMMMIIIAVVVLAAGGGGAFFMMGDKGGDAEAAVADGNTAAGEGEEGTGVAEAHYFSLEPPFIVNFTGKSRARFLQVSIEGLTRDANIKEELTKHFPQIRNNLILLMSAKTHEELSTAQGKETLRKEALKEVQKVLEAETGKEEGVEDIYFTSFVIQ